MYVRLELIPFSSPSRMYYPFTYPSRHAVTLRGGAAEGAAVGGAAEGGVVDGGAVGGGPIIGVKLSLVRAAGYAAITSSYFGKVERQNLHEFMT